MSIKCASCDKEFQNEEGLEQHIAVKHPTEAKKQFLSVKTKKSIQNWGITFVIVFLILGTIWYFGTRETKEEVIANITTSSLSKIPTTSTHWHPRLTIIIDNQKFPIPAGIGIRIGNVVDVQYGIDAGMAPTHTHDGSGVIHLENNNPRANPETFALGYFFYVWDKEFSKDCIFDYCTDKGILTISVNGKENNEFENYIMQDKDDIVITYVSFANATQNSS